MDVQMSPDGAAEYWRQIADRFVLHDDVALETRRVFADLVAVFPYGVLRYEIFTLVHDKALFVLEQALRDRLVKCGPVPRTSGLSTLLSRARELGLLEGQRTKAVENVIRQLRNDAAHPVGYHLLTPVDTARTLSDLTEIINHLWGHDSEGGRLYPAPLTRHTVALAWNPATHSSASSLADNLSQPEGWHEFTDFALVQAPWPAPDDLHDYDSWFETTTHPVDYLWGPGSRVDALTWLDGHPPVTDTVEVLGRQFLIRVAEERLWRPMRRQTAARMLADSRSGHWYLVGADTPAAAFAHVRNVLTGGATCHLASICPGCDALSIEDGDLTALLEGVGDENCAPVVPPDFHLPGPMPRHRYDILPPLRRVRMKMVSGECHIGIHPYGPPPPSSDF